MYRLVAIDLDGTLLDSYGRISEYNKDVLKRAKEKGVEIVLASGRHISSVKGFAKDIGENEYIICGNGATLYNLREDRVQYGDYISKEKALKIIKYCEDNSIFYTVYTDKTSIAKAFKYNVSVFNYENLRREDSEKTDIRIEEDIYKYILENDNQKILKITVANDEKIIFDRILRNLREIDGIDVLDVSHMSSKKIKVGTEEISIEYYYTEITSKGVNKWKAIEKLMEIRKLNVEEVMTIGDGINDVEMIENAGLGVAMGNGYEDLKKKAKYIAEDNNNDGVGKTVEKYILEA